MSKTTTRNSAVALGGGGGGGEAVMHQPVTEPADLRTEQAADGINRGKGCLMTERKL